MTGLQTDQGVIEVVKQKSGGVHQTPVKPDKAVFPVPRVLIFRCDGQK